MMRNVFTVIFHFIARLAAVFLALLAVIATIAVLLLLSIDDTILKPRTSKQAFVKNKVYERLPVMAAGEFSLVRSLFADQCTEAPHTCAIETVVLLKGLNSEQWDTLISHLLPADELQLLTESTLDEALGYFDGTRDSVQITLAPLKARLRDQSGEEIAELLLGSQPACSAEQLTQLKEVSINRMGVAPIICSPSGEMQLQLSTELRRRLTNISAELPETATIIKAPSPSLPMSLRRFLGADLQILLQKLDSALPYAPLLPLGLLLLLTLFAVRSLRAWMRWWSTPIFIAGLITLIFGVLLFFMFDQLWMKYVLHELPPLLSSGFGEITQDLARTLANEVSKRIILQAGILTILALATLYASYFVKPPPDPSLPPLAQPGTPGGPVIHPSQEKKRKGW